MKSRRFAIIACLVAGAERILKGDQFKTLLAISNLDDWDIALEVNYKGEKLTLTSEEVWKCLKEGKGSA